MHYVNAKDNISILGSMTNYEVIKEIWDGNYNFFAFLYSIVIGFYIVSFNKIRHKSDLFIVASQAQQVFYADDELTSGLFVALSPPMLSLQVMSCFSD